MPAGRPRQPTEIKKIKGTINTTREKQNPNSDVALAQTSVIVPDDAKFSCPKSITDRYCKKYWKTIISNMMTMRVLSYADIPQIETLCVTLQKLREAQMEFSQCDVMDPNFDLVERRWERLSNKFDTLAAKYYVSPQARTQLKLSDLNLIKTAQEIQKNDSAINTLLNNRQ